MKYAIYDVLCGPNPINVWDGAKYVQAIYDNEFEATKKVRELNAPLSEVIYVVKPYVDEVQVTLEREEAKAIIGLCSIAIDSIKKSGNGQTEHKVQLMQALSNKISESLKTAK